MTAMPDTRPDLHARDAWTRLCSRRTAILLTAAYLVGAALLLTNFDLRFFAPEKLGLVFDDMAARLLHWDFTISPAAIQFEAFVRDGRTYTYYGIFPALLRVPLVLAGYGMVDVARLSCLVALGITVYAYVRLIQAALTQRLAGLGAWCALLSAALTGPQVYILASASLYHEIIFWAAALVATFNLIVLRRWFRGQALRTTDLVGMAVLAGASLLCRAPAGVALYAALLLLMVHQAVAALRAAPPGTRLRAVLLPAPWLRRLLAVGCLALLFVVVQGVVNQERWGDPLVSSPYASQILIQNDPVALDRFARHGLFSWTRVGVASLYYSTGVKLEALLPATFAEYYGGIEGPRALVPLCAPLMMLLTLRGFIALLWRPRTNLIPLLLLVGNAVGFLFVLGFVALCLRYTFDAWGMVILLSAIGLRSMPARVRWPRWALAGAMALLLLGITGSMLTLLRYKIVYSGTDARVRFDLSRDLQPLICPQATLNPAIKLTDFNPLVTPNCPPLW